MKLSKSQDELEVELIELEERSRLENIGLHGIAKGSSSTSAFIEILLQDKLDIPTLFDLGIERAHHSLGSRPLTDAPPHSIIVKFTTFIIR